MDNTILTLYPLTDAALTVLKDRRNAIFLVQTDANHINKAFSQGGNSALSLTLDQAPKSGSAYVIGRHHNADVVLEDTAVSARHCIISINDQGVPFLLDQSTNGTLINGIRCNKQSLEIQNGMVIDIRDAVFEIRVPWRGSDDQLNYEYKVKRMRESRATPVASSPLPTAPTHTILEETLGSYTITNTFIDSLKVAKKEVGRSEIVRKGCSFFAIKRFCRKGLNQQALRSWEKILESKIQHVGLKYPLHLTVC